MKALVPRTDSPSLGPCPASGGASSFLLASALLAFASATRLLTSRRARRAMRLIDFCHPKRNCVHPHLARSRLASAAFAAWAPRRVWALRGLTGGPGVSRRPRPLRRIVEEASRHSASGRCGASALSPTRAWALSSHGPFAIEPLTSLSPLPRSFRRARFRFRDGRGAPLSRDPDGREGAAKTTVTTAP